LAITDFVNEKAVILADLDQREALLHRELDERRERADRADRRLLTAQGDDLRAEVISALKDIGFTVTDVDTEAAKKGDLLEDLRVTDPDSPGWIALAEVRGYGAGAKVSDLQRIGRFVERYIKAEGKPPSSRWYVVNHHIGWDPSIRPTPLASNREEVELFSEVDGLVIDTRSLFTIRHEVRTGLKTEALARRSFRESRGWYR
jgi:hypothetical protein